MSSFSVIAALPNKEQAEAVGKAMERFVPQPIGVGVCEIDEISGDLMRSEEIRGCEETRGDARRYEDIWGIRRDARREEI